MRRNIPFPGRCGAIVRRPTPVLKALPGEVAQLERQSGAPRAVGLPGQAAAGASAPKATDAVGGDRLRSTGADRAGECLGHDGKASRSTRIRHTPMGATVYLLKLHQPQSLFRPTYPVPPGCVPDRSFGTWAGHIVCYRHANTLLLTVGDFRHMFSLRSDNGGAHASGVRGLSGAATEKKVARHDGTGHGCLSCGLPDH